MKSIIIHVPYLCEIEQLRKSELGPIPTLTFQVFHVSLVPSLPCTSSCEQLLTGSLAFRIEVALHASVVISLFCSARMDLDSFMSIEHIHAPKIHKADPHDVRKANQYPLCSVRRTLCLSYPQVDPCEALLVMCLFALEMLPFEASLARFTPFSWPNLLPYFDGSGKSLQMSRGGKPIFITPLGTLDSHCASR